MKSYVALFGALMVLPGLASADAASGQGKVEGQMTSFQQVDADGSGAISADEAGAVPGLADIFNSADKDGNGQLSRDEYEAALSGKGGARTKGDLGPK